MLPNHIWAHLHLLVTGRLAKNGKSSTNYQRHDVGDTRARPLIRSLPSSIMTLFLLLESSPFPLSVIGNKAPDLALGTLAEYIKEVAFPS